MDFEWSQTNVMTQCTPFILLPLADLWLPHDKASLTTLLPFLRNEYCSNIVFTCFALCAGGDIVSNTPILPRCRHCGLARAHIHARWAPRISPYLHYTVSDHGKRPCGWRMGASRSSQA